MPLPPDVRDKLEWVADGVALVTPTPGWHGANSMLIDEGDVVLVDAGLPPGLRHLLAPHVDVCILTHTQPAHVVGARDFREVWAPFEEGRALASVEGFCDAMGVARRDRETIAPWLTKAGFAATDVAKTYRAGGILAFEKSEWHFIAAHGHSPGLTLLLDKKRHILFGADIEGVPAAGGGDARVPWYGFPSCDLDEYERAVLRLADVDVALLLSSHAPARKRGIRPLFRGVADEIARRDKAVLAALSEPRTLDELVDAGLLQGAAATASPLDRYHERVMVEKHIGRLLARDYAAARQDGRYERLV
ncbi:MAG: MBL fold metallo-hydrolase [Thermoplasmatota archaeon]